MSAYRMSRRLIAAGALILIALAIGAAMMPAWAAAVADVAAPSGETGIRIDFTEPVTWVVTTVGALATALVGRIIGLLPGPARWAIKLAQIDQVIYAAIRAAVADNVPGDKPIVWTGDLKNTIIRDATVKAINTGNKFVLQARDTLADKVKARLQKYIDEAVG